MTDPRTLVESMTQKTPPLRPKPKERVLVWAYAPNALSGDHRATPKRRGVERVMTGLG